MSDRIDDDAGVEPSEDAGDSTPPDSPTDSGSTGGATGDEPPASRLSDQDPVTPPPAEEPEVTQTAAAASAPGEAPTQAQTPIAAMQQSWARRRWVRIVVPVAAAAVLLLGGVAIGSAIEGDGDHDSSPGVGHGGKPWGDDDCRGERLDGRGGFHRGGR